MTQTPSAADDRRSGLVAVVGLLGVMWVAEIVDTVLGGRLDALGIEPRDTGGLSGVVLAPFLHGGFGHLVSNTVPFLVLGALVALSGLARVLTVAALVTVISGLGVWLFAPATTLHIGASGVVFGFAAYLVGRGWFDRRVGYVAVALLVVVVYGTSLLLGLLPRPGVSWQGHLFGAVGGLVAARLLARPSPRRRARPAA
ncbi:MAG TPA: rhomboid family intramembrane serine protease [Mycobacteriales bacterium]|nr:rhomboid family intramembrane serine protease [Mycobacteriales bacterium]